MSGTSPIFIGGLFKSGTTLFRAMLGQHSEIAAGLETYWFDMDWKIPDDARLAGQAARLGRFYDFSEAEMNRIVGSSRDVVEFLNQFLGAVARREGKQRWAEKTPGNVLHIDRIRTGWPDAKIVHIIRDPRDVLASLRQANKWDSIEEFTNLWCDFLGAADAGKKTLDLNEEVYKEIRYESLIREPEETMHRVLSFLEAPWDPTVARFAGKADDYDCVLAVTGKASTTLERLREPMSETRIGLWRKVLRAEEVEALSNAIAERGLRPLFDRIVAETPR